MATRTGAAWRGRVSGAALALRLDPAYGAAMGPSAPRARSRAAAADVVVPRIPPHELARRGERFVGAQVPGTNPEHWIAERAPPSRTD